MQFVSPSGVPLDIEAMKKASKKPKPAANDAFHKGWIATGFPPERLAEAEREHERKVAAAAATNRRMLPWDESRYMRDAKPTKVRSKPYGTLQAASDACDLARRSGWKGCTFAEVSKGSAT